MIRWKRRCLGFTAHLFIAGHFGSFAAQAEVLEALRRDLGVNASLASQSVDVPTDPFVKAGRYIANWNTEYLGILRSDGNRNLSGSWQDDWIGSRNLSAGDSFQVFDFCGKEGLPALVRLSEIADPLYLQRCGALPGKI